MSISYIVSTVMEHGIPVKTSSLVCSATEKSAEAFKEFKANSLIYNTYGSFVKKETHGVITIIFANGEEFKYYVKKRELMGG